MAKMGTGKGLITPAEPEAQPYGLWWMGGLGKIIACCGKFCLMDLERSKIREGVE